MKVPRNILFFALLSSSIAFSQVGIGTTSPNASLEVVSSNIAAPTPTDGILIPKVSEFPVINPSLNQDGMLVYATGGGSVSKGFYYWDNATTLWTSLAGTSIDKIDELLDGKSDNDGTNDGSSVFLGVDAGLNDDGSDNRNAAFGYQALLSSTVGARSTAIGYQALFSNTDGIDNVANGYKALTFNTSGNRNTANGEATLFTNTTGSDNSAYGARALFSNITGSGNVAVGNQALTSNTTGVRNVANGYQALLSNVNGHSNTAVGDNSLAANTTGSGNSAVGRSSMGGNISGVANSALGNGSLSSNTVGSRNTAIGNGSMSANINGVENVSLGYNALLSNTSGEHNVAIGPYALRGNLTGTGNVAIGRAAGHGASGVSKSGGVFIGNGAGVFENNSNRLYIENSNSAVPLIYGEFDTDLIRINGRVEIGSPVDTNVDGAFRVYKDALTMVDVSPLGGSVFNEQGDNLDFRAEGNTVSHLLFLDAGDDVVRFGRSNTSLTDDGNVINGIVLNYLADFENPISTSGATIGIGTTEYIADLGTQRLGFRASLVPAVDNTYDLGFPALRWDDVYATNGIIQTSDLRDKENMKALDYGLAEILQIETLQFQWKNDYDRSEKIGFSAQQLLQLIPEVVKDYYYEHPEDGSVPVKMESERLGVYYSDLIPVMVKAIQQQDEKINRLEARLEALENN